MPPKEKGRQEGDPIPNNVCQDTPEYKSVLLKRQAFCADRAISERESKLWQDVQRAYAKSRCYRAGDDPEYARALAEFDRVANPRPANNVIPFRPIGGRS
jgi:hypothetical protein